MHSLFKPALSKTTIILLLGLLAACAEQSQPGYYDPPRGSTATDAHQRAEGRKTAGTPGQLQIGLGQQQGNKKRPATAQNEPQASAQALAMRSLPAELSDTRSYLGTIPCAAGQDCQAMRLSLTLAPDGQWRSRNTPLDGTGSVQTYMGCWYLSGTKPTTLVLQVGDNALLSLKFIATNVIQINWAGGQQSLMDARLTRQADIDPIAEITPGTPLNCRNPG